MSNTEQKIEEILRRFSNDQVEAMGIFKGGWSDESMAVFEAQVVSKATTAKQAILQLITEARIDEIKNACPRRVSEEATGNWETIEHSHIQNRISELRKGIK